MGTFAGSAVSATPSAGSNRPVHLLSRRHGNRYPSCVAVIAPHYHREVPRADGWPCEFSVDQAALGVYRVEGGKVRRRSITLGTGPEICERLYNLCRRGSSVWCFAPEMYRVLCGLRFFERIDGTQWEIQSRAVDTSAVAVTNVSRPWAGFCVFEDRVTILLCRRVGGGTLRCTGTENYSAAFDWPDSATLTDRAEDLLDWSIDWIGWLQREKLGSLQNTLAAQAMYAYRKRFLHHPIVIHNSEKVLTLERRACHGGRCEVFYRGIVTKGGLDGHTTGHYGTDLPLRGGSGDIYHLDANSLYGFIARHALLPSVIDGMVEGPKANERLEMECCIADVDIEPMAASVPYRPEDSAITLWPTGYFRTQLCKPELELVKDQIRKVHAVAWYRPAKLFSEFASFAWTKRCESKSQGNTRLAKQLKAFSQLLYGKFAQRARGWRHVRDAGNCPDWGLWWQVDRETGKPAAWRSIAGKVERHFIGGETYDSCPAITAYITSLARVWLWELIQMAGRKHVLYVDTDSLFVDTVGFDSLRLLVDPASLVLGALRLVGVYCRCEFYGIKHYVCDGQITCAGVAPSPPGKRQGVKSIQATEPLLAALAEGRPPQPHEYVCRSNRLEPYRHGVIQSDGWVKPFHIGGSDAS